MESMTELLIRILFCVNLVQSYPIRLSEGINGHGKIPNLIRDYLYSKNFENVMRNSDKSARLVKNYNRKDPELTREIISKNWRDVYDIKDDNGENCLKSWHSECKCKTIPQPTVEDILSRDALFKAWIDSNPRKVPISLSLDEALTRDSLFKALKNGCTCKTINIPQSPLEEELVRKTMLKSWKDLLDCKHPTQLPPLENVLTRELILKTWKEAFDSKSPAALPPTEDELNRKSLLKTLKEEVFHSKSCPAFYNRVPHVEKPGYHSKPKPTVVLLPMLNVVADPDKATNILKALGIDDAPTIYPDGKFDFYRNRDKLPSIFSSPIFNQPSNLESVLKMAENTNQDVQCKCECTDDKTNLKRSSYDNKVFNQFNSEIKDNSVATHDSLTPKSKEWEINNSKELNLDGDISSELMKMLMYLKINEEPVTFSKAAEICSKQGLTLPIIRNQMDLSDLREVIRNERDYWIGLGKSECQTGLCSYRWLDGEEDTRFLGQFEAEQLKPKSGPIEFCTIRFHGRKSLAKVKCLAGTEATAHYICTRRTK